MQHQRLARVGEEAAVAGVEVALRRQALGEQDGVRVELDVEILDRGPAVLLADGRAVDQLAGADQLAVDEDGVIGRDQQIGVRHVVREGAAPDADRGDGLRVRMRGEVDAAAAEPFHRLGVSSPSDRVSTMSPCSRLSTEPLAGGGQDARAGGEADDALRKIGAAGAIRCRVDNQLPAGAAGDASQGQHAAVGESDRARGPAC